MITKKSERFWEGNLERIETHRKEDRAYDYLKFERIIFFIECIFCMFIFVPIAALIGFISSKLIGIALLIVILYGVISTEYKLYKKEINLGVN